MSNLTRLALFALFAMIVVSSFSANAADVATSMTEEPAVLAPIIAEGTPAEAMKFDPIVPAYTAKTKSNLSSGNIGKELANDLPFHSSGNLRPGNEAGFIGVGKGVEETDVNVLGIPINRPQGGGSDLATFPQYFWSSYHYQIGPSLGAYDPRGVGGSLTLRLWTQENLGTESQRATAFHSTRKLQQFSYGRSAESYAALVGVTTGEVFGPALSFSGRVLENGATRVTTHLLLTDTNVDSFYSEKTPTQEAQQRTIRAIPVVQIDHRFTGGPLLKSSLFHDFTFVNYEEENFPTRKQTKYVHQVGTENALLFGDTRIGLGFRNISYKRKASAALENLPQEQVVNLQATQTYRLGAEMKLEPTIGATTVTRLGTFPYATVGARHETNYENSRFGQFFRIGYHQRFPSLLDRYYELSQYRGPTLPILVVSPNPGLRPENVRSIETGVDFAAGVYRSQLTLFARDYKHARYTQVRTVVVPGPDQEIYQIKNAGDAYVFGGTHSQDLKLASYFDVGTRATFQRSKIYDLGTRFPHSPEWVGILKGDLHDPDQRFGLEVANKVASKYLSYGESSSSNTQLPGYYYMDLFARVRPVEEVTIVVGVENVFDREIQYQATGIPEGRVYSLSASAQF